MKYRRYRQSKKKFNFLLSIVVLGDLRGFNQDKFFTVRSKEKEMVLSLVEHLKTEPRFNWRPTEKTTFLIPGFIFSEDFVETIRTGILYELSSQF